MTIFSDALFDRENCCFFKALLKMSYKFAQIAYLEGSHISCSRIMYIKPEHELTVDLSEI